MEDAQGNDIRLEDLRGKVVILNFVYARCKAVCPSHSRVLATVQQQLSQAGLADQVQFVSVSTDTEDAQQTAAMMRAHGPQYGLDTANWVFLHGGAGREDAGVHLAQAYGLQFVPTGAGEQMHGVVTHLIDAEGRLRARYHGLKFNPVNLTLHAGALIHGDHHARDAGESDNGGANSTPSGSVVPGPWVSITMGLLGFGVLLFAGRALYRERTVVRRARPPSNASLSAQDSDGASG